MCLFREMPRFIAQHEQQASPAGTPRYWVDVFFNDQNAGANMAAELDEAERVYASAENHAVVLANGPLTGLVPLRAGDPRKGGGRRRRPLRLRRGEGPHPARRRQRQAGPVRPDGLLPPRAHVRAQGSGEDPAADPGGVWPLVEMDNQSTSHNVPVHRSRHGPSIVRSIHTQHTR